MLLSYLDLQAVSFFWFAQVTLRTTAISDQSDHIGNCKSTTHNRTHPLLPFQTMTFRQAIKTREILLIILASISANISNRMISVHMHRTLWTQEYHRLLPHFAVATIGGFSLLGRMVMGFFQDKVVWQSSMSFVLTTMGGCMAALPFIRSDLIFFLVR